MSLLFAFLLGIYVSSVPWLMAWLFRWGLARRQRFMARQKERAARRFVTRYVHHFGTAWLPSE